MNKRSEMIEAMRRQRENPTPAEMLMYEKLRFRGFNFVYIYGVLTEKSFFTADFYIPKYRLIIEIDGGAHNCEAQKTKDMVKDMVYEALGYNVLRIKNSEVDTFNTLKIKKLRKQKTEKYYYKKGIKHEKD